MKRADIQLPYPLYQKVDGIALHLHLSAPEVLRRAGEPMMKSQAPPAEASAGDQRFLANEPGV